MAITTVKDALNVANPADLPARLYQLYDRSNNVGFGDMLDALRPRAPRQRTSLASNATQVHDVASWLVDVFVTAGTPLVKVYGAAAGAGEVRVEYDATTGVPTLTFGDGAVTDYWVVEMGPMPQGIAAAMATTV